MVQQGARIVFTTWFGLIEPTRAVAKRHLDVAFYQASGAPDRSDPVSIGYYFGIIEEARYISGEIAGLAVEPGANIGYVAAHPIPEVFRGENAFALGVMKTNPTAKIYNTWTLTWFDPTVERQAAESLLDPPIKADLLSQHQDAPATQLVAQDAGKLGIGYDPDMSDQAPKASLTSPVWNWAVHNKYTIQAVCPGTWSMGGKINMTHEHKYWMGSFQDGTVQLAPLNTAALANHPRREQIQQLYNDEVAAFRAGQNSFETSFTGPIKDNTGQVRIKGKPDSAALYDERPSGSSRTSSAHHIPDALSRLGEVAAARSAEDGASGPRLVRASRTRRLVARQRRPQSGRRLSPCRPAPARSRSSDAAMHERERLT